MDTVERTRRAAAALWPVVVASQTIPVIALAPLLVQRRHTATSTER